MNILKFFPYSSLYYWKHPHKFLSTFFYNIKMGWQRATKGFCALDSYDLYTWFLKIMPLLLDDFIKTTKSYPPNMTYEEWIEALTKMQEMFVSANEEKKNEYEAEYMNLFSSSGRFMNTRSNEEVREKWLARENEIELEKQESFYAALELFKEYFYDLWS